MKKFKTTISALFSAKYGIALMFSMLIASFSHQAAAQYTDFTDYTKMLEVKSQFTIDKHPVVRYINEKQRLVLDQRYADCGGGSCFARYDDYTPNAELLWLPHSWDISDFIIYKDVVFFCGHTTDKQAIVGYFLLSQFPSNQLHFYLPKEYVDFHTIELYTKDFTPTQRNELHLVMTTTRYDGLETLVDCYNEPGSSNVWHFEELNHHFDNGIHFVDLAVTNDFVLATSIENGMGYLWYFKRTPNPLFYDGRIARNPVKCITDYRLETCGDYIFNRINTYYDPLDLTNPGTPAQGGEFPFVTVATDCDGFIHVDCFNGSKHMNHLKSNTAALPYYNIPSQLYDLNTPYPLRDVSWCEVKTDDGKYLKELDILYYNENRDGAYSSHIIHIPHRMLEDTVGDIMNEMIFHKYSLWTLDNTRENVPFLAAGSWERYTSYATYNTPLQLIKYTPGANRNCSDLRQVLFIAKPPIMKPEIRKTYPTHEKFEELLNRSGSDIRPIDPICEDYHPGVIIDQTYYNDFHEYIYGNAEDENTERSMMTILNPSELSITPNPAKEQVTLDCSIEMTQVDVIDASGRQMLSKETSSKTFRFDVSEWSQGLYVIIAHTTDGIVSKKLVVE